MRCPSCKSESPDHFVFCGHCGAPLPRLCPHCSFENPPGFSFCGACGANLADALPESGHSPLSGERRFVVVLFADIAGFTRLSEQLDAEEATKLVNLCLEQMTEAVLEQGGHIDKYTGDGLMAVFGAPTAHEDDPERALRTALAMEERMGKLRLDLGIPQVALHIGMACGQVVAAWIGGRGQREYTVIGTSVNLANRLEGASLPGQTLVSEELARLTWQAFSFRPLTLSQLQGWDDRVQAYELLGSRAEAAPAWRGEAQRLPLMGRDAELALLQQAIAALSTGRGGIVSIIGDAGMGKSRLLHEARLRKEEMPVTWLEGSALETGESLRYGCFRTLLLNAIGISGQSEPLQAGEQLHGYLSALMPDRLGKVYPYLGRLMGVPLPQEASEWLERLEGESLKWQMTQALREWLAVLAQRTPVVLVFENLHWVDLASAELLERMLSLTQEMPLLVIGVYRPEADRPAWPLRERSSRDYSAVYTEIWLRPLPSAVTQQMVAHLLGTERVPPQVLDLVLRRTEGNPLFVEEIVRSMIDREILVRGEDGLWKLTPAWTEVAIPHTLQGILQARIDQLDSEARRVLQVAACIGRRFPYDLLAATTGKFGIVRERLDRCLNTLEEAGLIQPEFGSGGREYTFRHVLLRDTVHNNLLKGPLAQFHTAIALWYEENKLQSAEPPYDLLAYHYEHTEDYDRQRRYFALAGRQAARSYANEMAADYFSKALALTSDPAERFELLLERERVHDLMGDRSRQRADLEELQRLIESATEDSKRAAVYNRLAYWHASQGDYAAALMAAETGLAAARRQGDGDAAAIALQQIAATAWRQGRYTVALEAAQQAAEEARRADNAVSEATNVTTMGVIYRTLGQLDQAQACYKKALEIRRALGDLRGEAISLTQLGNVMSDQGEYTTAFDYHQQALDLFRLVGERRSEAWSLSGLGTVYLQCGDYEAAQACFEKALALRRAVSDRRGEAVALGDLGNALAGLGRLDAAEAHLEQALVLLRALGARRDELQILTALALVLERRGKLNSAQAAYQAALARSREQGQQAASVENMAGLARIALEQGDLAVAMDYIEEVIQHLQQHGLTQLDSPSRLYLSAIRVLQASGEAERAARLLDEAHRQLQARARRIVDPVLRRSFTEHVPENQAILELMQEHKL